MIVRTTNLFQVEFWESKARLHSQVPGVQEKMKLLSFPLAKTGIRVVRIIAVE